MMTTLLCKKSGLTGKQNTVAIPMEQGALSEGLKTWRDGALIQDAFPTLSDEDREFIMTGITAEEWEESIGSEEE